VDGIFRKIERWIEGDAIARKRLDDSPWNGNKWLKKSAKWAVFTLISLIIGHSFLAYFTGTEVLAEMMQHSPFESPGAFGVMAFIAGLVLFDFGWFREQFCLIACPYGRLQSVLMDDRTMVVAYDPDRGEPRRGAKVVDGKSGDCVNCYRCVAVCPTGVDIRRGVQLECIACTACADVCDTVMVKLGKPKGLIRYKTLDGNLDRVSPFRPRSIIYAVLLVGITAMLAYTVSHHKKFSAEFVRALETPYQVLPGPNGQEIVTNHFKLDLRNQDFSSMMVRFRLEDEYKRKGFEMVAVQSELVLNGGESRRVDVFFKFPKSALQLGTSNAKVELDGIEKSELEVKLVGPLN
jgi:cytochrome c oxidase accessory protein FixG